MDKKEFAELWYDDWFEEIEDDIDDSWRHGNNHATVFYHEGTKKYYRAYYRVSGDGEYHGLRPSEMDFEFEEVTPITETVVVTKYVSVKKISP